MAELFTLHFQAHTTYSHFALKGHPDYGANGIYLCKELTKEALELHETTTKLRITVYDEPVPNSRRFHITWHPFYTGVPAIYVFNRVGDVLKTPSGQPPLFTLAFTDYLTERFTDFKWNKTYYFTFRSK